MKLNYQTLGAVFSVLLIASCSGISTPDNITQSPGPTEEITTDRTPKPSEETLITPSQIGSVRLGMTFGELKQQYPQATYRVTPLPDIPVAIAVTQSNEDLFYFVTNAPLSNELPPDNAAIELILTNHSRYSTASGIKPGSSLAEATQAYGDVNLYFSPDAEYAEFQQHPETADAVMGFWVQGQQGQAAGEYQWINKQAAHCESAPSGYCETTTFDPNAKIAFISIANKTEIAN